MDNSQASRIIYIIKNIKQNLDGQVLSEQSSQQERNVTMEIIYSIHQEGSPWSREEAELGKVRTGPLGLLGILETRLGLQVPEIHPVHRINAMMGILQMEDRAEGWAHSSFFSDPWATARELLSLRDQLALSGWRGEELKASPRLQTLWALEQHRNSLPPGEGERLGRILEVLEEGAAPGIREITLLQPPGALPVLWQRVFQALEARGVFLRREEIRKPYGSNAPQSNLEILQAFLLGEENLPPLREGDESLLLYEAPNEWEGGKEAALWLAAGGEANRKTAVICGKRTEILDLSLERLSLPRMAKGEASPWREKQQLLPLILAMAWNPPSLKILVMFLTHPLSPIPSWAGRRLLEAISKEPGIGGDAWKKAMNDIRGKSREYDQEQGRQNTDKLLEDIEWLTWKDRHDPGEGISEESLRRRCRMVADCLRPLAGKEPSVPGLLAQGEELAKVAAGKGFISRILLEQILETLIGEGTKGPESLEEAAPWMLSVEQGGLAGKVEELLWFPFNDSSIPNPTYWSRREREELASYGIFPPAGRELQAQEAASWTRALLLTEKRFVAISLREREGEEVSHHPFQDLLARFPGSEKLFRPWPGAPKSGDWHFAGRSLALVEGKKRREEPPALVCQVAPGSIPGPQSLSYSSLKNLIGCPLNWVLDKHGKLKPVESQNIPTGNQMVGSFAHRIVERLYLDNPAPGEEEAMAQAESLYEELITSMALSLLEEGSGVENRRYRKAVVESVGYMAREFQEKGLRVRGVETALEGKLEGISFTGYADILLEDPEGTPVVVDMKWSSSDKYFRENLKGGIALQLATYAWLLQPGGMEQVQTAYYMLKQRRFVTESSLFSGMPVEAEAGKEAIWKGAVASLQETLKALSQGEIQVRGLEENGAGGTGEKKGKIQDWKARGLLYQEAPCRFCHYQALCGKGGEKA